MEAAARGAVYYDGSACKRCGGVSRYVIASTCVTCTRQRSSTRDLPIREAAHRARKANAAAMEVAGD